MPEPVIYMRGFPPVTSRVSREILDDLKAALALSRETVDLIADTLAEANDFLDTKSLTGLLQQLMTQESAPVGGVRRIILNLEADDVPEFLDTLRHVLNSKPDDGFPLTSKDIDQLGEILPRLLKPVPALRRYRKAERLAKITGQPLEDVQLICDLRPVFDAKRERIEGLMPYTRMKIVATGGDGLPRTFEAELTAQQVSDLQDKAGKAITKLLCLTRAAKEWKCAIPDLPLTRDPTQGVLHAE